MCLLYWHFFYLQMVLLRTDLLFKCHSQTHVSILLCGYKNKGIVLNSILSVEFNNTTSLVFHFIINYQWYIHFVWKIDFIFYDKKILFMKLIQLKYPVLKSSRSCFYSFPKLYFNSTSKMIYSMIKKIEFMKLI